MNVWLASYPRSGNTFLRIILRNAFGLTSRSVYSGEVSIFDRATEVIGHDEEKSGGWPRSNGTLVLTKTHDKPLDDGHAIYVVRDGRSTLVSYFHYLNTFSDQTYSLVDVIEGHVWPGSWSDHYRDWIPTQRPNTLLLRYEDLRDASGVACAKIADFLGVEPVRPFDVSFVDLQRLNPRFFRSANDKASTAEMAPYADLFTAHHGPLMAKLGYGDEAIR
jgi:hypothetical protein